MKNFHESNFKENENKIISTKEIAKLNAVTLKSETTYLRKLHF